MRNTYFRIIATAGNEIKTVNCSEAIFRQKQLPCSRYKNECIPIISNNIMKNIDYELLLIQSGLYYPRFLRPKFDTPNLCKIQ